MSWQSNYLKSYYDAGRGFINGTQEFWSLCSANAGRQSEAKCARILEIGSGPVNPTTTFLATLGETHGIDVDSAVLSNNGLASASLIGKNGSFEVAANQFDLCVSDYVLEHLECPEMHFREVMRVLRPGGAYVFRTPNRRHYVALAARVTPHWVHEAVANRLRAMPKEAHEPYPTWYRANSRSAVSRLALGARFCDVDLLMIEKEPQYGLAARPLFLAFMAYERLVNSTRLFEGWRANILGIARKRKGAQL